MSNVDLGFIEKVEPWKLRSKFFPSKVGGFPAWLPLKNLPSLDELSCKKCNKPLAFLCQLYAPQIKHDHSFHRTIFVFICRDPDCSEENNAQNTRIFRSQLPRINDYYDAKPPNEDIEEGSEKPSASDFSHLCAVCGSRGPKFCGQCKLLHYCSRDHQAIDWKSGHKLNCKSEEKKKSSNTFIFPEFLLDMDAEEVDETVTEKSEEEVMQEYKELLSSGRVADPNDDEEDGGLTEIAAKETDKQFQRFRTRIRRDPNQVIRYEREGIPLFVSSTNKPIDIPPCQNCGKERKFEFQVMPQLLVHLKVDTISKSIDWGTILVYTCPDSCKTESEYFEEVCYKQDYDPRQVLRQ